MSVIIPRFEWRTFGHSFGGAEAAFAAMTSTGSSDSDETYLLSTDPATRVAPTAIVKIRFELMDIKVLREVTAEGLERWEPVLKVGSPMPAADVARVCEALGLQPPSPARDLTLEQFLDAFAGPGGPVRAVEVHKHRVRYTVGGCSSEVSDVVADGRTTRTIAIESEDQEAVVAAVRSVGLEGYVNTNYPRGVAALLDGEPERYAVIDVGTNSIKFHVAELDADGRFRAVVDRAEVTRLGQGIDAGGSIVPEALDRATDAIEGMAKEARGLGVRAIAAVGTAGITGGRKPGGRPRRRPRARRRGHPGHPGRGGGPARLCSRGDRPRRHDRQPRRLRHRAAAARSSRSATTAASTSSTASRWGRCDSPSGSGWPEP